MSVRVEKLTEYEQRNFERNEISEKTAAKLYAQFGSQIDIEPPSFLNGQSWKLTSKGWVGYIPVESGFHLYLAPKIPIGNLFGMLEYAYRVDFKTLDGISGAETLFQLYERLAFILAKRVLKRIRKGIYRAYINESSALPYVRGKIDIAEQRRYPFRPTLQCQYEDHTADIVDNKILLWTLKLILQSGLCGDRSLPFIRQAHRELNASVTCSSIPAADCIGLLYNRLNSDYEVLHALCRFFLESTGPSHELGEHRMLPILVKMDYLFEQFVFEWLKEHLKAPYVVREQEPVDFQMGANVSIAIDITIEDGRTGETIAVLDTKYKAPEQPESSDIQQVVAYAEAKNCTRAILVYPSPLTKPIGGYWGKDIYVQSLPFKIAGNLEEGGREFLACLGYPEG